MATPEKQCSPLMLSADVKIEIQEPPKYGIVGNWATALDLTATIFIFLQLFCNCSEIFIDT